jgi:hypothetical protein
VPVLSPTAAELAGAPKFFVSRLPPAALAGGELNPLFAGLSAADFGARHLDDATALGALVGRGVAVSTGWPQLVLPKLQTLAELAADALNPDAIAKVLEAPAQLQAVLGDVQKGIETLTGVPIVGLVLAVGGLVFDLVKIARARAPKVTNLRALGYDETIDTFVADSLVQRAKGTDWTPLFLPPAGNFAIAEIDYTRDGSPDGYAWGQIGPAGLMADSPGAYGLCPGVAQIAGYWQSPWKTLGSTRDANIVDVVSSAKLVPSTTTLAGLLYTAAQSSSPMLCRLDLMRLAAEWEAYGDALADFADSPSIVGGHRSKQIKNGWRWSSNGEGLYGVAPESVPAEYRGWGLQNLIAYRLTAARKVVRKNLRTIACAYVAPDAPGLSDPLAYDQWVDSRKKLLVHNARQYVDATIIPDAAYRSAMLDAQKFGEHVPGAYDFAPGTGPKAPPKLDALSGEAPDEPLPPVAPPGPEGLGGDNQPGGAGLGLAALAALGVWALSRK